MNVFPRMGAYRIDVEDTRDMLFGVLRAQLTLTVIPVDEHILPVTTPISDQIDIGSCVCNAACDAVELLSGINPVQLSRLDLYWKCRAQLGEEDMDEGTYPRTAFSQLAKVGVARESLWPYDTKKVFVRPPISALEDAYNHRITGYFRINSTGAAREEEIRHAILTGHPVVFGTEVGEPFCLYDGSNENLVWNYPAHSVGGHAMVIVGFRKRQNGEYDYLIRNSWGLGWGSRAHPGHAWASSGWVRTFTDLWVPTQTWQGKNVERSWS